MHAIRSLLVAISALLAVTDPRIGPFGSDAARATGIAPERVDEEIVPGPLRPTAPLAATADRTRPGPAPRVQEPPRRAVAPPQPVRAAPATWIGNLTPVRRGSEAKGKIVVTVAGRELKLTDFSVADRPMLEIWLSAADPGATAAKLQETKHVSLGRLRKPRGDQVYRFPAELDPAIYRTVVVWSRRDRAPDAVARLTPARAN